MTTRRNFLALAAPAALLILGGCATGFKADVARFQAMPAPAGQSFTVKPEDPKLDGSLEFARYASLVSDNFVEQGYQPAPAPDSATLVVKLDYGVDKGREKIRSSPSTYGPGWYGDPFYWGPYRRWGRHGYIHGFYDPFMFGGGYNDVQSYTVYTGGLSMIIERKADGQRVFEGKAEAISSSNKLTYLVPNLIEAMFTNFPGNSGETVKITVPPPAKD